MTTRVLLNAARWLGIGAMPPSKQSHAFTRRRLSVESLEDRRVLSATSFLTALYQDVLNRAPDSAGLTNNTSSMAAGSLPITMVADFWESTEHRGLEVTNDYQTFLNRAPDPAGFQGFVNMMLSGTTEESLMTDFLTSPEFQQLNPSPTNFVTALYHDVLGRAPDPAGLSGFVTELANNTASPSDIVSDFINSTERHTNLVDSYFTTYLDRAPDPSGQAYWVQQLDQGLATDGTVAQSFLSSQEFRNNNFVLVPVAGPEQIVVTIVGNGSVTDTTGQINTLLGQNVAIYAATYLPMLQASATAVWSLVPTSDPSAATSATDVASVAITPSEFAQGLNVVVSFD